MGFSMVLCLGCTKDKYDNAPLSGSWLLPLLKGEISPITLSMLNNKEFDFYFTAEDAGLNAGIPISSPIQITLSNIGAFPIEMTDIVQEAIVDSGAVELKVTNNFPVTIMAGTILSLKTAGHSNPLATLELTEDLAPNASKFFQFDLSGKQLSSLSSLEIEKLIVDSFADKYFDSSYLQLQLFFRKLSIREMLIAAQKSYEIRDTADFNNSLIEYDEYDKMVTDSTIHATIHFKAINKLPVGVNFQIYFLDMDTMVVDSLFNPVIDLEAAEYAAGALVAPSEREKDFWISKEKIDKIKQAVQVIYSLDLSTFHHHGAPIRVTKEQTLFIKATGDIQMVFNPAFVN